MGLEPGKLCLDGIGADRQRTKRKLSVGTCSHRTCQPRRPVRRLDDHARQDALLLVAGVTQQVAGRGLALGGGNVDVGERRRDNEKSDAKPRPHHLRAEYLSAALAYFGRLVEQ